MVNNAHCKSVAGILFCLFLSGAAGLVYQVVRGKALGLIFGHTVYAIAPKFWPRSWKDSR